MKQNFFSILKKVDGELVHTIKAKGTLYDNWVKEHGQIEGMMSPEDILSMESGMMGSSFGAPIGGATGGC